MSNTRDYLLAVEDDKASAQTIAHATAQGTKLSRVGAESLAETHAIRRATEPTDHPHRSR